MGASSRFGPTNRASSETFSFVSTHQIVRSRRNPVSMNLDKLERATATVNDNQAPNGDGGGIWLGDGTLTVQNGSSVSGNSSGGDGGGIWNGGTLTVVESSLTDNTAMEEGGGIFCDGGDLTLCDVVFDNNSPDDVAGNCQAASR